MATHPWTKLLALILCCLSRLGGMLTRRSELVINQEIARMGARGYGDGLNAGMVIGLPPVMNFGHEPLRSRVLDEVFSGQKVG